MRHEIDAAHEDIVLNDDASGSFDGARCSAESQASAWGNGETKKVKPRHWRQRRPDFRYFLREDERQPRQRRPRRSSFPIAGVGLLAMGVVSLCFADSLYFDLFHSQGSQQSSLSPRQRVELDDEKNMTGNPNEIWRSERAANSRATNEPDWQHPARHAYAVQPVTAREATAAPRELAAPNERRRQTFEEEIDRRVTLASELAEARRELQIQAEQSKKAADEAWKQKQTAERIMAELRHSLQQEQDKTAALMQEIKVATTAAELQRRAVEDVREHAAAVLNEIAERRGEAEQSKQASEAALKQMHESVPAELRPSPPQEREQAEKHLNDWAVVRSELEEQTIGLQENSRVAQLNQVEETATALANARPSAYGQAAALREANGVVDPRPTLDNKQAPSKNTLPKAEAARQSAITTLREPPVSAKPNVGEVVRLMALAKSLVISGNIRAARDVLERAAESGSVQAVFALAETYDPNVLAAWRTRGTVGDATRARDLYEKALGGGFKAAKDRSRALVIANGERKPIGFFGR